MNKVSNRRGFTIIEVVLFLAVSGLLMAGLMVGTGLSVARQRYSDSVSNFSDILKRQYAAVTNVQNSRNETFKCTVNATTNTVEEVSAGLGEFPGRTDCLIYGRLIEFTATTDAATGDVKQDITSTNILGRDLATSSSSLNNDLDALKLANLSKDTTEVGSTKYNMLWGASLKQKDVNNPSRVIDVKGAIMIVRAPLSGTVKTFITDDTISPTQISLTGLISTENLNYRKSFCVDSPDLTFSRMRMVRVNPNGENASAVEVVSLDTATDLKDRCDV